MPRWTKKDKQRVRAAIDHIAGRMPGGQADIARELGLASRAVVNNWRQRGAVPIEYHQRLIAMAPDLNLTPDALNPIARQVAQINGH